MLEPPAVPLPPGWYDDPESPHRLRYFDGAAWTERTSGKGQPAPRPPRAPGRSNITAGLILAVLAVAVVVLGPLVTNEAGALGFAIVLGVAAAALLLTGRYQSSKSGSPGSR